MKITRCSCNSYYDADRYDNCPHCKNGVTKSIIQKNTKNNISKTNYEYDDDEPTQVINNVKDSYVEDDCKTQFIDVDMLLQNGNTLDIDTKSNDVEQKEESFISIQVTNDMSDEETIHSKPIQAVTKKSIVDKDQDDLVTLVEFDVGTSSPVVGWVVCIEGEHLGESFEVRQGINLIGRLASMDICISNDRTISREKHAVIVYEPNANVFYFQQGNTKSLLYVNDEVLLDNKVIVDRDILKIGKTKVLFVALCNETFSWEN